MVIFSDQNQTKKITKWLQIDLVVNIWPLVNKLFTRPIHSPQFEQITRRSIPVTVFVTLLYSKMTLLLLA